MVVAAYLYAISVVIYALAKGLRGTWLVKTCCSSRKKDILGTPHNCQPEAL